ncbi:ethylene-responsive transcription factor ERF017 [Prunus avium]|uniref:Ethylene-responsive transcription factor ERF017 n=1 Tax=Prunus avium TaxID=42229 RepID=A0A6P5RJG0_PRUAV|nr:ethylene-responsive transcription factor ERF017 [Prunus avium]
MVKQQQTIGKPSERNDFKYKGVRKRKWGKWVSEIRLPNSRERIWLGSYDSAEKAARAFDAALFCLRGRTAKFNFPDNPPNISGGRTLSPAEIQAEAARFANSEPPTTQQHSDQSMSELQTESQSQSPSPSVSEGSGTVLMDSDFQVTQNDSFSDLFRTFGSGNYATEYGLFPGFDELNGQFFSPATTEPTAAVDYYAEENLDGVIPAQESFLWNF